MLKESHAVATGSKLRRSHCPALIIMLRWIFIKYWRLCNYSSLQFMLYFQISRLWESQFQSHLHSGTIRSIVMVPESLVWSFGMLGGWVGGYGIIFAFLLLIMILFSVPFGWWVCLFLLCHIPSIGLCFLVHRVSYFLFYFGDVSSLALRSVLLPPSCHL